MTENTLKSDVLRTKRNQLKGQLRLLAAQMENKELNKSVDLAGRQSDEQLRINQYKIQAGKLVFELYELGECESGTLNQVLDYWSKKPYSESADWNYLQGFESICWQWYGNSFGNLKKELGELCAYAHIIRLLVGHYEHQDID
jgi:hypothetical protein